MSQLPWSWHILKSLSASSSSLVSRSPPPIPDTYLVYSFESGWGKCSWAPTSALFPFPFSTLLRLLQGNILAFEWFLCSRRTICFILRGLHYAGANERYCCCSSFLVNWVRCWPRIHSTVFLSAHEFLTGLPLFVLGFACCGGEAQAPKVDYILPAMWRMR